MLDWWKAYRSVDTHPVWKLPATHFKVWFAILNKANYTEGVWYDGKSRIVVPPGTLVTSQDHLADYCHLGRQIVRSAIKNLIRLESISTNQITNRYTVITVINWNSYQHGLDEDNQLHNQSITNGQPTDNHNIRKGEGKKERRKEGKKEPPPPAAPSECSVLLNFWSDLYLERNGQRPEVEGKRDMTCSKAILSGRTLEQAKAIVTYHFDHPSDFYADKHLFGIHHIRKDCNQIIARMHNGNGERESLFDTQTRKNIRNLQEWANGRARSAEALLVNAQDVKRLSPGDKS